MAGATDLAHRKRKSPREVGDEYAMDSDGDATEWFQSS